MSAMISSYLVLGFVFQHWLNFFLFSFLAGRQAGAQNNNENADIDCNVK